MAFPAAQELLDSLLGGGEPLNLTDAEAYRTRWIDSLEYQPASAPTTAEEKRVAALAEMVVEEGTLATLEARQLRSSGLAVPANVYERINSARALRSEYNNMKTTETDEEETAVGYVGRWPP